MLTIDRYEIHLTRGDTAYIKPILEVEREDEPGEFDPYEFKEGDRVIFRLASNSKLLIEKECYVDLEANKATLTLIPDDTKDLEPRAYSYCVELVTVFDEHFTAIENARFVLGKELEKNAN